MIWCGMEVNKKRERRGKIKRDGKSMDYMFGRRNLKRSKRNFHSPFCPHSSNFSFKYDNHMEMLKMLGCKKKLSTGHQKHFA